MKKATFTIGVILILCLVYRFAQAQPWYKQPWDSSRVKPCDRVCLVEMIDNYLDAVVKGEPSVLPFAEEVWYTENTARLDIGEGILWHSTVEPTTFNIHVADPVTGQVALQSVLTIEGQPALAVIRLKIEQLMITEIEHLIDRDVAPEAMKLLRTPRPGLLNDVPASERSSREMMIWVAHSYFDALTGESGKIGAFADECVRHECGYQTINNEQPGHAMPSPILPDTSTPEGRAWSQMSTMTCAEQLDTKIFSGIKKIWPRRILIVDEQKGVVASFPLFVHDGTRRTDETVGLPDLPRQSGLSMILNMVTMETFGIHNDKMYEIEAFPFITFPYGLGDGWTPGRGR